MQLRDWTDKDGNKRRSAEIVADSVVDFVGGAKGETAADVQPDEASDESDDTAGDTLDDAEFMGEQAANNVRMIRKLLEYVTPKQAEKAVEGGAFEGMTVVLTGTLSGMTRDEAQTLIEKNGGDIIMISSSSGLKGTAKSSAYITLLLIGS